LPCFAAQQEEHNSCHFVWFDQPANRMASPDILQLTLHVARARQFERFAQ
jgi:hypothetical protein